MCANKHLFFSFNSFSENMQRQGTFFTAKLALLTFTSGASRTNVAKLVRRRGLKTRPSTEGEAVAVPQRMEKRWGEHACRELQRKKGNNFFIVDFPICPLPVFFLFFFLINKIL